MSFVHVLTRHTDGTTSTDVHEYPHLDAEAVRNAYAQLYQANRFTGWADGEHGLTLTRKRCQHGMFGDCRDLVETVTFHDTDPREETRHV